MISIWTLYQKLKPNRTQSVFYSSGFLFALAFWIYAMGACNSIKGSDGEGHRKYQYDSYSLIPGLISTFFLMILNLFSTRTVLERQGFALYGDSRSRIMKFFVFTCISFSLASIALALLFSVLMYGPEEKVELGLAVLIQTILITIRYLVVVLISSSFIIFFMRDIDEGFL